MDFTDSLPDHLGNLPDELIMEQMNQLSVRDILSMRLVNQRFNRLSQDFEHKIRPIRNTFLLKRFLRKNLNHFSILYFDNNFILFDKSGKATYSANSNKIDLDRQSDLINYIVNSKFTLVIHFSKDIEDIDRLSNTWVKILIFIGMSEWGKPEYKLDTNYVLDNMDLTFLN